MQVLQNLRNDLEFVKENRLDEREDGEIIEREKIELIDEEAKAFPVESDDAVVNVGTLDVLWI